MWLCEWEAMYGVFPPERAYKDDDEPFVITQDGEKICQSCANNWHRAKKQELSKPENNGEL
jgi:hypothetical protein